MNPTSTAARAVSVPALPATESRLRACANIVPKQRPIIWTSDRHARRLAVNRKMFSFLRHGNRTNLWFKEDGQSVAHNAIEVCSELHLAHLTPLAVDRLLQAKLRLHRKSGNKRSADACDLKAVLDRKAGVAVVNLDM